MHWCNGFSGVLELRCNRWGWRRVARARCFAGGGWRLQLRGGRWLRAQLRLAWLAGDWAGLAWKGDDGSRYAALVCARRQALPDWRRLRVRLRVPGA